MNTLIHRVNSTLALGVVTLLLSTTGCETAPTAPTERIVPKFDYTPPEIAGGDVDITLAVVGSVIETSVPMFQEFATNMAGDFMETLNVIGYRVRGPYRTYDQMTFPDKEGSELILSADMSFDYDASGLEAVEVASLLSALQTITGSPSRSQSDSLSYTFSGPVTLTSRITLVLYESLTKERMWTKSLSLDPIQVTLEGSHVFSSKSRPTLRQLLEEENQFYTDVGRKLGEQYQRALSLTYSHLDPREVQKVSAQADSLRERKRY